MNEQTLKATAAALTADGKGLLAMDESNPTADKRFAALGIPQTPEMRRAYRDMIVTAPGLSESIGGAILYDETIRTRTFADVPFAQALEKAGIVPGIKVDAGAKPLALHDGELVTEGLDGLRERLAEYSKMGARFAKWRAVITIDDAKNAPSRGCYEANAQALARYAALCQEAGIVPIVEPEVLMDGAHTLARCAEVTERALHSVFDALRTQRVLLEGMILKPNMVRARAEMRDAGQRRRRRRRHRARLPPRACRPRSAASRSCPAGSRRPTRRRGSTRCTCATAPACRGRWRSRSPARSRIRR